MKQHYSINTNNRDNLRKLCKQGRMTTSRLYWLKIYSIISCFLFFTSCNNEKKEFIFSHVENIVVDTVPLQNVFSPTFMTITKDVLTITSYDLGNMLHFYKIPTLKYMYSTGGKGQGPFEFQAFPMICQRVNMDMLYIWGYTPLTINKWELKHDSLSLNKTYTLDKYETFNQLHVVQDSILIYSAIPSDFSIKKYNLNTAREIGKISLKMDKHRQPFYSSNYGFVAANDSCIVYAYHYKKQIDIYDISSLSLKKRISGNYYYQPPIINDNDNNAQQYIALVAGEKYFYVLYRGGTSKDKTVNSDVIEVFDYNGNPITKYAFNICPQIFTIDEPNQMLYGFSSHFEDYLIKCRLIFP